MTEDRPDYTKAVQPVRTIAASGQANFALAGVVPHPAATTTTTTVYTVPSGYILNFISGIGSVSKSIGLTRMEVLDDAAVMWGAFVAEPVIFTTAESGGYVFDEGSLVKLKGYNTSAEAVNIYMVMYGTLHKKE